MLILSRKQQESVIVGGSAGDERVLEITVLQICGGHVKLAFEGSQDVPVHRLEVWERIRANGNGSPTPQDSRMHNGRGTTENRNGE